MSTMLRSAAMTLLSKTLLTFLYKYLSDVDVEGVEMPSLYGSTDGATSGWGVRLSNVKLREGAELMVLPGGRKAKPKTNSKEQSDENPTTSSKRISSKNNGRKREEEEDNETLTKDSNEMEQQSSQQSDAVSRTIYNAARTHDNIKDSSVNTTSTGLEELDSEGASSASLEEGEVTRPVTPTQQSGMSFLSCFAPGSAQMGKPKTGGSPHEVHEEEPIISSETQLQGKHKEQYLKDINGTITMNGGSEMNTKALCDAMQEGIDEEMPRIPDLEEIENDLDEEEDLGNEIDEEDEDGPLSPPMALRIGDGGHIGTLDVR